MTRLTGARDKRDGLLIVCAETIKYSPDKKYKVLYANIGESCAKLKCLYKIVYLSIF